MISTKQQQHTRLVCKFAVYCIIIVVKIIVSVFVGVYIYYIIYILYIYIYIGGTRWRSWLRHCVTSRKVAGSIPDGVIRIFH